jgi:hypothetical protein
MSSSSQQLARDAAIAPRLIGVKEAAERWARASRDGVSVWEVGTELLPEIWEIWRSCLLKDGWNADLDLLGTLDGIGERSGNADVVAAVAAAKQALQDYREPT